MAVRVLTVCLPSEIPIDRIIPNPFNSRTRYIEPSVGSMADSLDALGLIAPICVRISPRDREKYELVYGHRRFFAAKKLGWKTILADIVEIHDQQMAIHSLTENFQREELNDYEKARALDVCVKRFEMTYEQLGSSLGITKQTVCNYLAMLKLFDASQVLVNRELEDQLERITEHHARVLSQVADNDSRRELLELVVKENLSVRELHNVVNHLRSWFQSGGFGKDQGSRDTSSKDREAIVRTVIDSYDATRTRDFDHFMSIHMFRSGYTLFSGFASTGLEEKERALSRERKWFYEIAPKLTWRINNLRISILREVAVCTFTVTYRSAHDRLSHETRMRGTVVLVKIRDSWRIFHEHYSPTSLPRYVQTV